MDEYTADRLIPADGRLGHIPGIEISIVIDGRAKNGPAVRDAEQGGPRRARDRFRSPLARSWRNEDIRA